MTSYDFWLDSVPWSYWPTATRTAVFWPGSMRIKQHLKQRTSNSPTQSVLTWRYFNHISQKSTQKPWTYIIEHIHIFSTVHRDTQPINAPSHHRDVSCGWAPFVDALFVRDSMASCRWRSHLRWGWPSATPGVVVSWGIAGVVDDKTMIKPLQPSRTLITLW